MKVAVVTPRFKEPPEWFEQCLASVREQTIPCTHIIVNDGADRGPENTDRVQVIDLPRPHGDYGDTARAIGSASAITQGFDAIAWLDADNWYSADHVESLLALHQETGAAIVTSGRSLHRLDGGYLGPCPEVDGVNFVDTSTFMVTRAGFSVVPFWFLMAPNQHKLGDRFLWSHIHASNISHAHSGLATLHYRTGFKVHYDFFGVEPPPDAKPFINAD